MSTPTVPGRLTPPARRGDGHTVEIVCPHCGRRHVHGAPEASADLGHRAAHCRSTVGYVIVAGDR